MEVYEGGGVSGIASSPDVNPALTFASDCRLDVSTHKRGLNLPNDNILPRGNV